MTDDQTDPITAALTAQRDQITAAIQADLDAYATAAADMPMPAWRRHLVARIARACATRAARTIATLPREP